MCSAVIIAKGDQGLKLELDLLGRRPGSALISKSILNDRRVLALQHEDCLLDLETFNLVGEARERIKTKLLEITKALRMHNRRVTVRGKIERASVYEKS